MQEFWQITSDIANFQLVSLGSHQTLTVKKLLIALTIILLGYLLARMVRSRLDRVLRNKANVSLHGIKVIDKTVFYSSLVLAVLVAIDVIHIPLTAFTFLGGGLAVGLGFGVKNLFNNFVSGFILLTERPVKVGDVVQVEDEIGVIEDIGMRSTHIHTENNIHIVLPNSDLLEKKIINWTMLDHVILTKVELGLSYGVDVDEATKAMVAAVKASNVIQETPDPFVLLWQFAESSIVFHVYFPIHIVNKMERWEKESKVRVSLYKALTAAGFVFTFPQRDIHLDTSHPLEVKVNRE